MGSSRGFASTTRDVRPIQARFHCGSGCVCLNRATDRNSPDHTPKGTRSPWAGTRPAPTAPTAWKHTISGSLSLPSTGYFSPFPHGTVRYRSLRVACLGLWSARLPPRFFVPGRTQEEGGSRCKTPTGLSPALVRRSRPLRLSWEDYLSCASSSGPFLQPHGRKGWRLGTAVVWAKTRFVRHYYGCSSLFLRLLRCFSWPGALRAELGIPRWGMSCLIRKSLDQGLLAAPQSISERCPVLHRHAAPGHPSCAHHVFPPRPRRARPGMTERRSFFLRALQLERYGGVGRKNTVQAEALPRFALTQVVRSAPGGVLLTRGEYTAFRAICQTRLALQE
jgi:hypothetical protein